MRTTSLLPVLGLLALALCAAPMAARAMANDWASLDSDTHKLLAPWQEGWITLSNPERERLLANAQRWLAMDAAQRKQMLQRASEWQALPVSERARLRARYAAWKALSIDDQLRVRAAASQFGGLTAPRQGALRANFMTQDGGQQDAWLHGPASGSWIGKAQAAFGFVPGHERDATLRMLQDLPADARDQLFALAARLPGDQRERLRRDLLLQYPRQRADMIRERASQ
jgi:hypothetical protein